MTRRANARRVNRRAIVVGSTIVAAAATAVVVTLVRGRKTASPLPVVGAVNIVGSTPGAAPEPPQTVPAEGHAPTHGVEAIVHTSAATLHFPAQGAAGGEIELLELAPNANGTLYLDIVIRVYPSPENHAFGPSSLCATLTRVATVVAGSVKHEENALGYDFCPEGTVSTRRGIKLTELDVVQHARVVSVRIEAENGLVTHDEPIDLEHYDYVKNGWGDREAFDADVEVRWRWDPD